MFTGLIIISSSMNLHIKIMGSCIQCWCKFLFFFIYITSSIFHNLTENLSLNFSSEFSSKYMKIDKLFINSFPFSALLCIWLVFYDLLMLIVMHMTCLCSFLCIWLVYVHFYVSDLFMLIVTYMNCLCSLLSIWLVCPNCYV